MALQISRLCISFACSGVGLVLILRNGSTRPIVNVARQPTRNLLNSLSVTAVSNRDEVKDKKRRLIEPHQTLSSFY